LLGQFIELDLDALLAPGANPVMTSQQRHTLPQDDLLSSGEYLRWKASTPAERP
jgi:hypothetical protein